VRITALSTWIAIGGVASSLSCSRVDPPASTSNQPLGADAAHVDASGTDATASAPPTTPTDPDAASVLGPEPDATAEVDPSPPSTCGASLPPPSGARLSTAPLIAHWEQPADPTAVALTFDDGPDEPGVTLRVLDVLRAAGVHATFFVNSRNRANVRTSSIAQTTLARIHAEGHEIGNHTAHHLDLAHASTDVEQELSLVEQDMAVVAPCVLPLTLFRAPSGLPYLTGPQAEIDRVSAIVARHAVEIGWSIDSLDWQCAGQTPSCWLPRVLQGIDLGHRGAILMHSTEPETADGLPTLITELRNRGLHFVGAEELVRAKYGTSSAQLVADWRATH
jgi:peptidoglycan/xylan/chitin deacetylase (PgdA/CDA1 family)